MAKYNPGLLPGQGPGTADPRPISFAFRPQSLVVRSKKMVRDQNYIRIKVSMNYVRKVALDVNLVA